MRLRTVLLLTTLIWLFFGWQLFATEMQSDKIKFDPGQTLANPPDVQLRVHKIGAVNMTVTNYGRYGKKWITI